MRTPQQYAIGSTPRVLSRDETRGVFGQVMGLVAITVGFSALGAYLGRNLSGGTGLFLFIGAFACIFGLQFANARGREQLAIALLFGLGLLLGMAVAPVIAVYAKADPAALWQAAGATCAFVAGCGAYGYATGDVDEDQHQAEDDQAEQRPEEDAEPGREIAPGGVEIGRASCRERV